MKNYCIVCVDFVGEQGPGCGLEMKASAMPWKKSVKFLCFFFVRSTIVGLGFGLDFELTYLAVNGKSLLYIFK